MFGKAMEDEWYANIAETEDQATFLRDKAIPRAE
jgi:hypothetical protein